MISFICSFIKIILNIFKSKQILICEIALLKKEIEILKRKHKKKIRTNCFDRLFFIILNKIGNITDSISIVKPETVLQWQREVIKRQWTYKRLGKKRGRKVTPKNIQDLILSIKNDNILWGVKRYTHQIT